MKIIYHCYGGSHSSPTAAAIHLGLIPRNHLPGFKELQQLPYFDQLTWDRHGKLIYMGTDEWGNDIFFLARRNQAQFVIGIIKEFIRLSGGDPDEYFFIDCMQGFNLFMVTGGYSSRGLGLVKFGRPIVTFGTILSFPILVRIVKRTIREVGIELDEERWLNNCPN